ncbi:glycoside hydrolase family 3 domain protein [Gemmatirosa kalamazoonensis]|uniref:beta-N-acetylhexosaminidase n=1 Tax=Gemmatirosa kalamazoonensis TaxID=861299 RepID=W0RIW3_9BACT|nr:glycoside hydrolase family 3 N-terminal domain-containing protein [Gemmatirosa kalamazoonensis]AHG90377.1 glycoside hydrolase family 3 domain protein [Gemmatirosa kalamazoonensis]
MSTTAELLVVALRADAGGRLTAAREQALAAIAHGVGGFVLFGGDQDAVRAFTKEVQQRSRTPLLIGADLERGAGQQFTGAAGLPPLAALAWLGDAEALRRASRLTAREARTMGVNWDLAPVVDLELADDAAVVGTRSLGADPAVVGRMAAEWITACQAEGVLACAKHFPGLGRAPLDADGQAPVVRADRDAMHATDLVPFRAAIDAGVASMMTAHAAYPALDPSGMPAMFSRELLQWLLRQQMRYDNLVVAHLPTAVRGTPGGDEGEAAVRALAAGCDVLLAPNDVPAVIAALERALAERRLDPERTRQSVRRRLKWAQWAAPPNDWRRPTASDAAWGAQLCDRVVHLVRGAPPALPQVVEVLYVDCGAEASAYDGFVDTLRTAGHEVRPVDEPSPADAGAPLVVALFPGDDAEHGDADAQADVASRVAAVCASASQAGRLPIVALFAHPSLASAVPDEVPLLCAWTGDVAMQRAAARWLAARRG